MDATGWFQHECEPPLCDECGHCDNCGHDIDCAELQDDREPDQTGQEDKYEMYLRGWYRDKA